MQIEAVAGVEAGPVPKGGVTKKKGLTEVEKQAHAGRVRETRRHRHDGFHLP